MCVLKAFTYANAMLLKTCSTYIRYSARVTTLKRRILFWYTERTYLFQAFDAVCDASIDLKSRNQKYCCTYVSLKKDFWAEFRQRIQPRILMERGPQYLKFVSSIVGKYLRNSRAFLLFFSIKVTRVSHYTVQ
jgi:hypothetical protein